MGAISIDSIDRDGTRVRTWVRTSGTVDRFIDEQPFVVDYDRPIEDVPVGILAIPVLAQVCPVAWACGADVYIDRVDAEFAGALERVKASMLEMHGFMEGGQLMARETVRYPTDGSGGSGLLYTGGVDSTYASIARRTEQPTLIVVRGWTITGDPRDDDTWTAVRSRVSEVAESRNLETAFVETNALSFLDHPMLLAHFKRYVDGGWYSSVGHGLGLLGLCAPLAVATDIGAIYLAATHWEGVDLPWGSRPDIDDQVEWSGTTCHHEGYHLTRQERIAEIAEYVQATEQSLELQTCNRQMIGNCGECEKCYRTALGLRLAGLEPEAHGYPFEPADYRHITTAFESGQWILGADELYMWQDLREHVDDVSPRSPAEVAFFEWLSKADLDRYVERARPPVHHRVLRTAARTVPAGVYRQLHPIWRSLTEFTRGTRAP